MVEKFLRIQRFLVDVEQVRQPVGRLILLGGCAGCLFRFRLVQPVRGHAQFCNLMHGFGADLEFDVDPGRSDKRGVQRLIAVVFRNGDEIFQSLRDWAVELVQDAQRHVAVEIGANHDPEPVDVVELGKAVAFVIHLAVDGKNGFFARLDARVKTGCGKHRFDFLLHLVHQVASPLAGIAQCFFKNGMAPRVQIPERQILQFPVAAVEAEPVGDRCINLQGFRGDARLCFPAHFRKRSHVVQAVSQLDENHAHIVGHGQQHLAK